MDPRVEGLRDFQVEPDLVREFALLHDFRCCAGAGPQLLRALGRRASLHSCGTCGASCGVESRTAPDPEVLSGELLPALGFSRHAVLRLRQTSADTVAVALGSLTCCGEWQRWSSQMAADQKFLGHLGNVKPISYCYICYFMSLRRTLKTCCLDRFFIKSSCLLPGQRIC